LAKHSVERLVQLLGASFEESATAPIEESVANEGAAIAPQISDVSEGMSRDLSDRANLSSPLEGLAIY